MATHEEVVKVWIAPGCIVCDACETDCPEVFDVQEETCVIRPEARSADFTKPLTPSIKIAAEGCPVDVIKFETIQVEGPEPWPSPEEQEAKAATSAAHGEGAGKKKPALAMPTGRPEPKWAGLLVTSRITGHAPGTAEPLRPARVPAGAIAHALPRHAPPDALSAAMVGAGFTRPKPTVAQRIREKAGLSRRDFAGVVAGTGVILAVAWGAIAASFLTFMGAFQSFMVPKVTKEPPTTFRAGKLGDYATVGVYEQFKSSNGVWIVHQPDGQLVALSDICTHLGCIPNWLPTDQKFKCPCHGSGYYINGVNFEGPAPRPLERFKITREGQFVVVDKSQKYRAELGQWNNPASYISV
ncbi:MAG: Rieske 2Fe-2S domain-containing protein [Phycisphaeraceae bacterium]